MLHDLKTSSRATSSHLYSAVQHEYITLTMIKYVNVVMKYCKVEINNALNVKKSNTSPYLNVEFILINPI
jgi:hypothetical protein